MPTLAHSIVISPMTFDASVGMSRGRACGLFEQAAMVGARRDMAPDHNHSLAVYGLDAPPCSGAASSRVLRICSRISSLDLTSLTSLTAIAPVR